MNQNKTIKFIVIFFALLILLSIGGVVLNVAGAIVGTAFSIIGLLLKLIFSKSVLTLLVIGFIAYLLVNPGQKNQTQLR